MYYNYNLYILYIKYNRPTLFSTVCKELAWTAFFATKLYSSFHDWAYVDKLEELKTDS